MCVVVTRESRGKKMSKMTLTAALAVEAYIDKGSLKETKANLTLGFTIPLIIFVKFKMTFKYFTLVCIYKTNTQI